MTEWDLAIQADKLKSSQAAMQESCTKIADALYRVKDEMILLKDVWKGKVNDEFTAAFFRDWEEACSSCEQMGKLIAAFAMVEKAFVRCEAKIGEM